MSQLYIILRVHYTPVKLHRMGRLADPLCDRCRWAPGDLIHLLWRFPKLHHYWSGVLSTLNLVFQMTVPLNPICCALGVLEEVIPEEMVRMAFFWVLFQARKVILMGWKSSLPPTITSCITHMGNTLIMERYIYQHRGSSGKRERLWAAWLDTPGLCPRELIMSRIL